MSILCIFDITGEKENHREKAEKKGFTSKKKVFELYET
jgi:hypothetical protein